MSNLNRIELRKIPIEQRIADLQIKAWNAEKDIGDLKEMIKAQASWIMGLEDRLRKLEQDMRKARTEAYALGLEQGRIEQIGEQQR